MPLKVPQDRRRAQASSHSGATFPEFSPRGHRPHRGIDVPTVRLGLKRAVDFGEKGRNMSELSSVTLWDREDLGKPSPLVSRRCCSRSQASPAHISTRLLTPTTTTSPSRPACSRRKGGMVTRPADRTRRVQPRRRVSEREPEPRSGPVEGRRLHVPAPPTWQQGRYTGSCRSYES